MCVFGKLDSGILIWNCPNQVPTTSLALNFLSLDVLTGDFLEFSLELLPYMVNRPGVFRESMSTRLALEI